MENGNTTNTKSIIDHDLHEQLFDLWAIICRHTRLVTVCIIIFLGLGALYYLNAPRTYESIAEIYVETLRAPDLNGVRTDDQTLSEKTIETHKEFIRSKMIVSRAMEENGLDKLQSVADADYPLEFIIERLTVEVTEENSNILAIRYAGENAEDCHKIASAITDTYDVFLGESNQSIGKSTTDLIRKAKDELLIEISAIDKEYGEFQDQVPPEVLFTQGDGGINLHRERQLRIEQKRAEKEVERTGLAATIDSHQRALDEGGDSREAIYYMALLELRPEEQNELNLLRIRAHEEYTQREMMRQYAGVLTETYIGLMIEKSELESEYGEGHDSLQSNAQRILMTRRMLKKALQNENPIDIGQTQQDEIEDQPVEIDYVTVYMQSLRDRLEALDTEITFLDKSFAEELQLAKEIQDYLDQDYAIRNDRDNKQLLYDAVVARLTEINLIQEYGGDQFNLLAPPELGKQIAPRLLLVAACSLFLGIFTGGSLAWLIDRAENTFRTPIEIRDTLQLPVIGRIPFIKLKQQVVSGDYPNFAPVVCTVHRHDSVSAEAYRAVRTSLYFSTKGQDHKVIQVSSPLPGDGKSTCVANLAVTIAKSGKQVLVVDADFRRPTMHAMLGQTADGHGLADVVSGSAEPDDAIRATAIENLSFVSAGRRPANPSELLSSPEFKSFIDLVRDKFDFVLVDTPPLLAVTDPSAVAARVDGVILALRIRKGVRGPARRSRELLANVGANVLGVVVNACDERYKYGYGGEGYGLGYGGYGYGYYGNGFSSPDDSTTATENGNGQSRPKLRFSIPGLDKKSDQDS